MKSTFSQNIKNLTLEIEIVISVIFYWPCIAADRSDRWHLRSKLRPGAAEVSATAESTGIASALGEAKECLISMIFNENQRVEQTDHFGDFFLGNLT